jgi:hypothetical protein
MAMAPFQTRSVPVRLADRGLSYGGITLGARAGALEYHLVVRVLRDRQWAEGTTATAYVEDLRRAVRLPSAQLAIFERRGGPIAAAIVATEDVLPAARRGPAWLSRLVVIYSADRASILTGYQFSTLEELALPESVQWLKRQ